MHSRKKIKNTKARFLMNLTNNATKVKLLTIKEAARLVDGLTEYRIRQLCISGKLPCFKAGKKYLINENALTRFLNEIS
jgi:excisionase family DNA binding protein